MKFWPTEKKTTGEMFHELMTNGNEGDMVEVRIPTLTETVAWRLGVGIGWLLLLPVWSAFVFVTVLVAKLAWSL